VSPLKRLYDDERSGAANVIRIRKEGGETPFDFSPFLRQGKQGKPAQ
jgi:hypothetical protein